MCKQIDGKEARDMLMEGKDVPKRLLGSDIFNCDQRGCRMSKSECLNRQGRRVPTAESYRRSKTQSPFPECQGCFQGMRIRMEEMMGGSCSVMGNS